MRIKFLCLYFIWNTVSIAEEISQNFLLDHYSLQNFSTGIGIEKESQSNQFLYGWYHSGKELIPSLGLNLLLSGIHYKRKLNTESKYFDSTIAIQTKNERLLSISPGFQYRFFSIYGNFQTIQPQFKGISFGLQMYSEKSLYFFYRQNPKEKTYTFAISVLSGKSPGLGLEIARETYPESVEWTGSISVSFQFESYNAAISHFASNERETNSFLVSKIFSENRETLFREEINPFKDDKVFDSDKKKKEWELKKFTKKERKIYEIKIDELLKFRIPLVLAIRISRASKSKEEYEELLKKLPPQIVRKCNKIQFDKSKANP